jgi:SAM-dependent methyltransferase
LNETIAYYDKNAQRFHNDTVNVDMSALYRPFLDLVIDGGRILDAGCGSGRDSLYFKQHGYQVEAFDASAEMCRLASAHLGQPVQQMTFDEVQWDSQFDGIWACASLLHVNRASLSAVLERLARSLKPAGVFYISMKKRDEEWSREGRFFNGYNEESFSRLIESQTLLHLHSLWTSADVRPGRKGEEWLNAMLLRVATHERCCGEMVASANYRLQSGLAGSLHFNRSVIPAKPETACREPH